MRRRNFQNWRKLNFVHFQIVNTILRKCHFGTDNNNVPQWAASQRGYPGNDTLVAR